MNSHTLFSKTPPFKLFLFAAVPGAISMLASALFQLIDGIFIGRFLGDTAFAALNLALPFVFINFSVADLIGVGSAVPISISLGRKQDKEANNIFTVACLMILATGIIIGGALFASAPLLIRLIGAEGDFAKLAVQYIQVYALCSPITTVMFAMDNYLRICGKTRLSMYLNILTSVLSIGLEFVFIVILRWGIWSAALATCIGISASVFIAFVPFWQKKLQLRFCTPRFSLELTKQIISCGIPTFLSNIAARLTSIFLNVLLVRLGGETAVSIYGILMYVDGFVQPLLYGMCDSLQPALGYNWGAGKYSRVRAIAKYTFVASSVLSVLSVIVIFAFPAEITRLFIINADGEFLMAAVRALKLFSIAYITRWFSFATQSYMLAVEKPTLASIISISTAMIFPALLVLLLWPLELTGLWLNFPATSLLAGGLSFAVLLKFRKEVVSISTAS